MPRVSEALRSNQLRPSIRRPLHPRRRTDRHVATPNASPDSTRLTLLAPSTAHALPSLEGIPAAYSHISGGQIVYELCGGLVQHDVGTPDLWSTTEKHPVRFVESALARYLAVNGSKVIDQHMDLVFTVHDIEGQDGKQEIRVGFGSQGCDYVRMGAVLDRLEADAPGLGGIFYGVFSHAINRKLCAFDESAAEYYAELYDEWMEEEVAAAGDEEEQQKVREQYAPYDVAAAIPECVKAERQIKRSFARRLEILASHSNGKHGHLVQRLLRITELAKKKPHKSVNRRCDSYEDGTPLPGIVVVFKQFDDIEAIFERESQSMNEYEHAPLFEICFDPSNPKQTGYALDAINLFLKFTVEVCALIDEINAIATAEEKAGLKQSEDAPVLPIGHIPPHSQNTAPILPVTQAAA